MHVQARVCMHNIYIYRHCTHNVRHTRRRMCVSCAGLSAEERERSEKVAERLGLTDEILAEAIRIAEFEMQLQSDKAGLFRGGARS